MHVVRAMAGAIDLAGGSHERFFARSGITKQQLEGPGTWLPVADYVELIETALELTGDPVLGLHFGERTSAVMFQHLAHLVEHSATLGEALDMIVRYTELLEQDYKPCLSDVCWRCEPCRCKRSQTPWASRMPRHSTRHSSVGPVRRRCSTCAASELKIRFDPRAIRGRPCGVRNSRTVAARCDAPSSLVRLAPRRTDRPT